MWSQMQSGLLDTDNMCCLVSEGPCGWTSECSGVPGPEAERAGDGAMPRGLPGPVELRASGPALRARGLGALPPGDRPLPTGYRALANPHSLPPRRTTITTQSTLHPTRCQNSLPDRIQVLIGRNGWLKFHIPSKITWR